VHECYYKFHAAKILVTIMNLVDSKCWQKLEPGNPYRQADTFMMHFFCATLITPCSHANIYVLLGSGKAISSMAITLVSEIKGLNDSSTLLSCSIEKKGNGLLM